MQALMPPVDTTDNKFHDGDPVTGVEGTIVPALHLNNVQSAVRDIQTELISLLTAAGMSPDSAAVQILNALKAIFQAKDAGLTSLAALAGGANLLPYYTAADVFAQTAFTAVGRSLVGQSTVAAALAYLTGAPLASPTFTGTPAAPTATAGTNTTQLATTAFVAAAITAATGRLAAIQTFTSSGTYTPTPGVTKIIVEMVGGGGGGGGAPAGSSTSNSVGGGGGSGAYVRAMITSPAASYAITVGSGGSGGTTGQGGTGGATTFGSLISCGGGSGGYTGISSNAPNGAGGGFGGSATVTSPAVAIFSSNGGFGNAGYMTTGQGGNAGNGATVQLGNGGFGSANGGGSVGGGYGSGGGGALTTTTTTSQQNGGAGAGGVVIVYEYY